MYVKDKVNRITLRLNDKQFEFVRFNAGALDVSPSEYIRMLISLNMSMNKFLEEGGQGRENDEADFDDII